MIQKALVQVLVETWDGFAKWMTPAEAWRYCAADPRNKIVEELDPRYPAIARMAGPQPQRFVKED